MSYKHLRVGTSKRYVEKSDGLVGDVPSWLVTGNSGIVGTVNYLGTNNGQPMNIVSGMFGLSGPYIQITEKGQIIPMNVSGSVYIGESAGNMDGGTGNIVIGNNGLSSNEIGSDNIAIGTNSLGSNTGGNGNIAIGSNSLMSSRQFSDNVAVGYHALSVNISERNTAVGYSALSDNIHGFDNTALGYSALASDGNGFANTAIGSNSMNLTANAGSYNVAIGLSTLANNSGTGNLAIGSLTLNNNLSAYSNIGIGSAALTNNTVSHENIAIGVSALSTQSQSSDTTNLAVGTEALMINIGSFNTALGYQAGIKVISGNHNIHIGNLGYPNDSASIKIGTNTHTTCYIANDGGVPGESEVMRIGNDNIINYNIGGTNSKIFMPKVYHTSIGTSAADLVIDSNTGLLGTVGSRYRLSECIVDNINDESSAILDLHPITAIDENDKTQYILDQQDIETYCPELNSQRINYNTLNIFMLNELKKLVDQCTELETRNNVLVSQISDFELYTEKFISELVDLKDECSKLIYE